MIGLVTLQSNEIIKNVSVFSRSDLYLEYSGDLPASELEKFMSDLRVNDSIHMCFYDREDKSLVVIMKQYFIDNPYLFDADGRPLIQP